MAGSSRQSPHIVQFQLLANWPKDCAKDVQSLCPGLQFIGFRPMLFGKQTLKETHLRLLDCCELRLAVLCSVNELRSLACQSAPDTFNSPFLYPRSPSRLAKSCKPRGRHSKSSPSLQGQISADPNSKGGFASRNKGGCRGGEPPTRKRRVKPQ